MENRLTELRKARTWSQADVAAHLGVSRQTIISIERGRFDPSLPLAFRIAWTFGCRIEDIFLPGELGAQSTGDSAPERVQ
ncbi:MAG: helix-turn-helix transcriptional regulator [Thermomicrobiales bacterium]